LGGETGGSGRREETQNLRKRGSRGGRESARTKPREGRTSTFVQVLIEIGREWPQKKKESSPKLKGKSVEKHMEDDGSLWRKEVGLYTKDVRESVGNRELLLGGTGHR